MREINTLSPEIEQFKLNNLTYNYIKVKEGEKIFFTKAIIFMCALKAGEYIHFLNEGKEWMFYSNDNPDGFKITKDAAGLLQINSYPLNRMILRSCQFQLKHTFYIKKTGIEHDKCEVFKMMPDRY